MHTYIVGDLEVGYRVILNEILEDHDRRVSPRGQGTLEFDSVVIEHLDPTDSLLLGVGRSLSPTLAAVEGLQLVGAFSDPKVTVDVAPQYARYLDGDLFYGAYGDRAGKWLGVAADRLQEDQASRQAIVNLWDNNLDYEPQMHDYPCSVYARFAVRDGKLRTTVHMRSNDAWLGYPYDVYQWTLVHRTIASFIGVEPGTYTHVVDSFHLYERNVDDVKRLLDGPIGRSGGGFRRTVGGILNTGAFPGESNTYDWCSVQRRARELFNGRILANMSDEEKFLCSTMRRYHGRPTPDELSGRES